MPRFIFAAIAACAFLLACSSGTKSSDSVFTEAIDYSAIPTLDNCQEENVRDVKYFQCKDSREVYETALQSAKAQGKPLMMTFGFNTCPYCKVLEAEIYSPSRPITAAAVKQYLSAEASQSLDDLTVLTVRIHARSDHGLKLADDLGVTQMAQARGWHRVWSPFVVFVNPETSVMASESLWEAKDIYCDWAANIAVSLERNGTVKRGKSQMPRKRCAKP